MALTEKYVSALAGGSGNGLSEGTAYTWAQMTTEMMSSTGTGGRGIRYNIKADGTYTRAAADSLGSGTTGTQALPIVLRGYKTTIGDGWLGRTSNNGPLVTTNMPLINYTTTGGLFYGLKYALLESLRFTGICDSGSSLVDLESQTNIFACSITNTATSSDKATLRIREGAVAFECDITHASTSGASGGSALYVDANSCKVDSCRIISANANFHGVRLERNTTLVHCLIKGAGGSRGLNAEGDSYRNSHIRNCTITNWQDGFYTDAGQQDDPPFIHGCMITDNSGWGINLNNSTASYTLFGANRFRDNVSGNIRNEATMNWLDVGRFYSQVTTDTGSATSDYTNPSGNDYSLISTSPGKDANKPYSLDMGAYGILPTGGGGTAVFHPLKPFIIRSQ